MKTIIIILALAVAAVAQTPCLENAAAGQSRSPEWVPARAFSTVLKIAAGGTWQIPIFMPAPGQCVGSFESFDDRDDVAVVITDAAGRYIRKAPAGDIEVLILDAAALDARNKHRSYAAWYGSGRQFSGTFAASLPAGWFYIIISNQHSFLAGKTVNFTLGRPPIGQRP